MRFVCEIQFQKKKKSSAYGKFAASWCVQTVVVNDCSI